MTLKGLVAGIVVTAERATRTQAAPPDEEPPPDEWVTGDPYDIYNLGDESESYSPWGGDGFQRFTTTTDLAVWGIRVNAGTAGRLYGPTGDVLAEWEPIGSGYTYSEVVPLDEIVYLTAGQTYATWSDSQRYTTIFWYESGGASAVGMAPADGEWPGTIDEEGNATIRMPMNLWGWSPAGPPGGPGGDT